MKWEDGVQGGGYKALSLLSVGDFHVRLMRMEKGEGINAHLDPAPGIGKLMHNAIIVLKEATEGGKLHCPRASIFTRRFQYYLPTKAAHGISTVEEGTAWMLFFTWCTKKKRD